MKIYRFCKGKILFTLSALLTVACSDSVTEKDPSKTGMTDTIAQVAYYDAKGNETIFHINKKNGDTLELVYSMNTNGKETITYKKKSIKE